MASVSDSPALQLVSSRPYEMCCTLQERYIYGISVPSELKQLIHGLQLYFKLLFILIFVINCLCMENVHFRAGSQL